MADAIDARRARGLPTARRDRRKVKEDKDEAEGRIPNTSKKTTDSPVDEEGKLLADSGKRVDATANARRDVDWTKRRRTDDLVGPSNSIKHQLSNARFVELGWTLLPVTKTMRKIVRYEARPAKPYLSKLRRDKGTEYYDDGQTPFAKFHPDGSGELFYPNGVLAVRVRRPENRDYDMYTVFTPGGKDALGIERESQILATFDTTGHGVVFDEDSSARLSYNQTGGIFTDNPAGLPLVWAWTADPREPILETVYTEGLAERLQVEFFPESASSSGNVKTPISPSDSRNKKKKVAEVQKPVVEERQEEVGSRSSVERDFHEEDTFQIRIICLQLNKFLSLRIIDRRNISLRFSAKNKSLRIELGTILNLDKEASSCTVDASDWKSDILRCRFQDKLSTRLDPDGSLHDLAKRYQKVKKFARQRKNMITRYKPFPSKSYTLPRHK